MDIEQEEMQFLGIFGIIRETINLIYTWRKIFTQITLALILPLSFIFLAHMELSHLFHAKITRDEIVFHHNQPQKLSDLVSRDIIYYALFQVAYLIFFIVFSLLSTSAVVYTVACIYTGRDVTFKQIMTVVPKVWKRLLLTFLCIFLSFLAFTFAAGFTFALIFVIIFLIRGPYGFGVGSYIIIILFQILTFMGFLYLTIIWQLSNVVSVLENCCGFKAMAKSKALIKGKMVVATVVLVLVSFPAGSSRFVFEHWVVHTTSLGSVSRGILGIQCFLLLFVFFLLKLVSETVLYLVCKSYHHENVDKSALSDHLQVYLLAEYVPLNAKDVQLEKLQVV